MIVDRRRFMQTPGLRGRTRIAVEMSAKKERARFLRGSKALIEDGLVAERRVGNQIVSVLTSKGLEETLRFRIRASRSVLPNQDRLIVTFDIPEHVSDVRTALRRFLKSAGFRHVHLSVWDTDKSVTNELSQLLRLMKCGRWVKLFIGRELKDE
ncbi:hypothetical protein A2856_03185 [Candidatus Uhrbacteria bacterium RIFCSPHIGHO2_01_FULL_63_20]|uniref:Transcriptional repressor PaaX-like central Cas2-like domain-containing protein n=1 Tax=Candidatus Uhrbacteria bacterium RIFCSPHIGHO2_01_FULL_63_20 TaxID=1802385 RepID=A0A1F7TL64_9BACT|nr:MAG: hypothetical protein A2856_03185 [Candidatus Uhrbacteria bacterium RIFCSPHIGHO2_01_FULL_63_20]